MLKMGRKNSQAKDAVVLKRIWVFTMRTVALLLGFQAIASIFSISKGFRERKKVRGGRLNWLSMVKEQEKLRPSESQTAHGQMSIDQKKTTASC